jgi:hypothetical protein
MKINDREIVLEAVKQNGLALSYASDTLKNDILFIEICNNIKNIEKDGLETILNTIVSEITLDKKETLSKNFQQTIDEIADKKYTNSSIFKDAKPYLNALKNLIGAEKFCSLQEGKYNFMLNQLIMNSAKIPKLFTERLKNNHKFSDIIFSVSDDNDDISPLNYKQNNKNASSSWNR